MHADRDVFTRPPALSRGSGCGYHLGKWYTLLQMQVPQSPTQQHADYNSEASASEGGAMRVPMRHEIRANRYCTVVSTRINTAIQQQTGNSACCL